MIESTFNPATCLPSELLIKNLPNKTIEQDVRRIANILKKQKLNSIQVAQLTEFLNSRSWGSWNEQRIREAVGWSKQKQVRPGKSKNPIDLRIQKGGKSITLIVAGGRHQKGAGTISLTTQAFNSQRLTETIKNKLKLSAWSAKAFDTHQSIRNGKWSSPDFVVCFFKKRKPDEPFEIHSFELQERSPKPKAQNLLLEISQAFACADGYQRCWFMVHSHTWSQISKIDNGAGVKRAMRLAKQLGVGLILFKDARRPQTWTIKSKARTLSYVQNPGRLYRKIQTENQQ